MSARNQSTPIYSQEHCESTMRLIRALAVSDGASRVHSMSIVWHFSPPIADGSFTAELAMFQDRVIRYGRG